MRNILLLFIALFSFGFAQAQDCSGADHTVLASNYLYNPSVLTVTAGETIAFLNEGGFHNVNGVSSTLTTSTWSNPETFSLGANSGSAGGVCMGTITLNTPGTYNYDCSIGSHAANGMVASIIVEAASSAIPTDNASDPTLDAGDVVSIYGGSYDNIANNYNPFWNQSGSVDPSYDPGTGNLVLQYANFNYQGTDVASSDLSGMTHLHLDVWVAADNDRMLKVTPISGGSGVGEFLVEVPLTPGSWNSVDLTKAAFEGMTWEQVFQMKFDGAFNADGSANGAGWDVYLDNIYFWNDGTGSGPPSGATYDVTFNVNTANITVGSNGMFVGGGDYFGGAQGNPMTDADEDGIWTATVAVPEGYSGNYVFLNSPNDNGDWNAKENLVGLPCADGPFSDRLLPPVNSDTTLSTCFGQCTTDGSCEAPATTYAVTFQVDMADAGLVGDEIIYVTGSFDGWAGAGDNVLTNDGTNDVYTGVVNLVPGSYEFKYLINGWGGDEQNIGGTACDFVPGDANGNRGFALGEADLVLDVQCFDFCGTCEEQNNQETFDITWTVNMSNEEVSTQGVFLAGGGNFGNPGDNPLTDNGDGTWTITQTVPEGFTSFYIFTNGACGDYSCKEQLGGLPCGDPANFNDRQVVNITADTTFNFCFGECGTDGNCEGGDGGGGDDPTGPTDNAADPTLDAGDVVSIYGGSYDNIANNYNPFWNQSGSVDPSYDPGTGNLVLQYANFNYQGTDVASSDLSGMTHLHLDVWVAADNDRMLKVTPISGGSGVGEFLVEVPLTPGSWNSVDLTKAAFEGMTWEQVFQMKFDGAFNADGSANGAGWDVYLDNIYFWNDGTGSGPPSGATYDVTFNVNTANITVGSNGMFVGGGDYFGGAQGNPMTDADEDGIWTATVAVPEGYSGNYVFLNSPNDNGDWNAKENLVGLPCADGPFSDRLLPPVNSDTTLSTCFGQCTTDGSCEAPATTYAVTFQVDMADAGLVGDEIIYVTGSFDGWAGAGDNVLTNDGTNDVYTGVVNLVPGSYEFKYLINGWGGDEQNIGGTACDFVPGDGNGNRGFALGEADLVLDVQCFDVCGPCSNGGGGGPSDSLAVTFNVDMNNYGASFGFVNVAGTWNEFCADCNQMTDEDEDGIWSTTIILPVGENYRYKFQVDSWADQEDLAPGDDPVGPCVVKQGGFTNRDLDVAGSDPIALDAVCWGSCFACIGTEDVAGCTDSAAANYNDAATANDGTCLYDVTFSVNMSEYPLAAQDSVFVNGSFNGYCGGCNAMLDEDEDGIYMTTIQLATDYYEYKYTVNAWSAEENLAGAGACVTENFGFTNRVLQLFSNQSQDLVCWNSCADCEGGGDINGCTDSAAVNYSDLATSDDGSCEYPVTFVVDMNEYAGTYAMVNLNGNFAGWCGNCIEMTDENSDNVYEVTVNLTVGVIEYKFTVDGWTDQETFAEGTSCTSTIDGFTNRTIDVTGAASLDAVCWNSCYACDVATGCTDEGALNYDDTAIADDGSCSYEVTLRLDMSTSAISEAGVHVAGAFQGWDPGTTPMSTPGLDLYEYTVQLNNGSYQYIFINGNAWEGQETVQAECGVDNGQGGLNREFTVAGSNMVIDVVCFGSCTACAGCTDPLSAEFSPFAGEDDGSCATPLVFGCTYADADNYNAAASSEDGSCIFSGASDCPTDIDGDGSTAVGDLLVILGAFGQTCSE